MSPVSFRNAQPTESESNSGFKLREAYARMAYDVLRASVLVGGIGSILLITSGWGWNVSLWIVSVILTGAVLAHRHHVRFGWEVRAYIAMIVVVTVLFAWTDSATLLIADATALLLLAGLTVSVERSIAVRSGPAVLGLLGLGVVLDVTLGWPKLVSETKNVSVRGTRLISLLLPMLRGASLIVLLLLATVFAFSLADTAFWPTIRTAMTGTVGCSGRPRCRLYSARGLLVVC